MISIRALVERYFPGRIKKSRNKFVKSGTTNRSTSPVFIVSVQRTGTKSQGQFFRELGYDVASWRESRDNNWTEYAIIQNYDPIFTSAEFRSNVVFEDAPWCLPGFFKYLFWEFPDSGFVFIERDPDKWFDSMKSHSGGKTIGRTHTHCIVYDRLNEFYKNRESLGLYFQSRPNGLSLGERHREHYKNVYKNYMRELRCFFDYFDPEYERIFWGHLEDPEIWHKLGRFFGHSVPKDYELHLHATPDSSRG